VYDLPMNYAGPRPITNTATATSDTPDPNPADNSATDTTPVAVPNNTVAVPGLGSLGLLMLAVGLVVVGAGRQRKRRGVI